MKRIWVLMLAGALALSGCSLDEEVSYSSASSDPLVVAITPEHQVRLPVPKLGFTRTVKQLLNAQYQEHKLDPLLVVLELKPDSLSLVGFSPLGVKLFSCRYDGRALDVYSPFKDKVPPLSQIVFDIMLAFYPVETVNEVLPDGFCLVDDGHQRLLKHGQETVTEISYARSDTAQDPLKIVQKVFNYQIKLAYLDN
ncbi:MAG: DUF3261 domain-containing protein [Succinivibrio sp.]|nr:DUF3261 domain-containing protein [Succinivibrio sp.]